MPTCAVDEPKLSNMQEMVRTSTAERLEQNRSMAGDFVPGASWQFVRNGDICVKGFVGDSSLVAFCLSDQAVKIVVGRALDAKILAANVVNLLIVQNKSDI